VGDGKRPFPSAKAPAAKAKPPMDDGRRPGAAKKDSFFGRKKPAANVKHPAGDEKRDSFGGSSIFSAESKPLRRLSFPKATGSDRKSSGRFLFRLGRIGARA
jgi:hypothetical protein